MADVNPKNSAWAAEAILKEAAYYQRGSASEGLSLLFVHFKR